MKVSYNWLQNYFTDKLPEPEKILEGITFHAFEIESMDQVGNDTVFDVKVLPDRAHDCLSHYGIAKEISAIFNLELKEKENTKLKADPTNLQIEVMNDKCLRYMGRIVRRVKVGPSPAWLKERLETIGQKSINNIVDCANYIMFDLGQPIHCFDLDKLESEKIIVRNGEAGEKMITLDKKEIALDDSILVIADPKDVLAIAGIKGGIKAEVDVSTKNIVIEVANFNPTSTRKTSKKIGVFTDAVKRYENEISPELCGETMDAITSMIYDLAKGDIEEIIDIYPLKPTEKYILISLEYINNRLGTFFTKEEIENVWERLGFEYEKEDSIYKIFVPKLRLDLNGPHDLVEDVIKILGYEKIVERLPEISQALEVNENFSKILLARNKLLEDGYSEVMTYVFRDKGEVEVLASASDKKFLRTNLTDGLSESMKLNQINAPWLEMSEIRIFEIGTVFFKGSEEMHVAYGDKKGIKEIRIEDFEKNMEVLDSYEDLLKAQNYNPKALFQPWSIYPFISRDIAVWVLEGESSEKLKKLLKENSTELLIKEPYMFDSFTKDGKTSYAFRLIFQSYERTLKDEEVNEIMAKISHKISENSSWEIR